MPKHELHQKIRALPRQQTGPVFLSHPTKSLRMKYVCPHHAFLPSAKTFYRRNIDLKRTNALKPE